MFFTFFIILEYIYYKHCNPLGWPRLGAFVSEGLSSTLLTNESKGFALLIELIALDLSSARYLSYVICELLHKSGGFPVRTQWIATSNFPCHKKYYEHCHYSQIYMFSGFLELCHLIYLLFAQCTSHFSYVTF